MRVRDATLPAAIAALGTVEMVLLRPEGWGYGIGLECTACLLLVRRRRETLLVCSLAAVVLLVMPWVRSPARPAQHADRDHRPRRVLPGPLPA